MEEAYQRDGDCVKSHRSSKLSSRFCDVDSKFEAISDQVTVNRRSMPGLPDELGDIGHLLEA